MIRLPTALHSVLPAAFPCTPTGGLLTLFALTPGWGQDCNLQVMKGKKMVYDKHFSPCQRRRLPTLLQLCQSVLKAVSVGAYQGVASPHLINNTGVSYTHRCSSSEWPYLTKVAVLLRLPNPPSLRGASMSSLTNATTSNTGRAAAFEHLSLSSTAVFLFCQGSLCHLHFFILTEVSSYNAYKNTNSFTFIFNESFKPERLEIFSTMVYFALEIGVMQQQQQKNTTL